MKEVPIDYPVVCECVITGGAIAASGGYGRNTQTFSRAENQACVTLKWKEQQTAGTAVQLLLNDQTVLALPPRADFKCIVVSTPELRVGQMLTVRTGVSQDCVREIGESIQLFPVTQGTGESARAGKTLSETQAPVPYGSMTACPASPALSELGYWLYVPDGAGKEQLPLIVYLHGGSGKGSDLQRITAADGFPQYLQTGRLTDVRAYAICSQCPQSAKGWQEVADQVFALIDAVCVKYPIDTSRIILTGHSMDGTGTWALAALAWLDGELGLLSWMLAQQRLIR